MRVFVAEKPELARAIVEALGGGSRKNGFYECGGDCVTWCFGHMLQLLEPDEYEAKLKHWSMNDLPFSFIPWRKKPSTKSKEQLKAVLEKIKGASEVVHAGDPDAEGQLLVDEILEYAKYKGPVKRILINDNNTASVKKALRALRDNDDFAGLSAAAEARQVADQLYGFNLTRLYTIAARMAGGQGVLSVGRVQTPILGLIVRRDRENEGHKKSHYYSIVGDFAFGESAFPAIYKNKPEDPQDDKGRLTDADFAKAVAAGVTGKPARIINVDTSIKQMPPPLPYNIIRLQMDAAKLFKMKPDKVKDITQTLREKYKLITYNRSDCQYLPEEHHADARAILSAIDRTIPGKSEVIGQANPDLKSRAFDSSKITAHHAIVPTQATIDFNILSEDERKIYRLIARAYIAQFYPPYEYEHTSVSVECHYKQIIDGQAITKTAIFTCDSNIMLDPGWKTLYGENESKGDDEEDNDQNDVNISLKSLKADDAGICERAEVKRKETKPKPLYTMASLLLDLTRIAEYVKDAALKKVLIEKDRGKAGEHGGIGTPATRDTIINTLFDREFIEERKKGKTVNIVSTDAGRNFYDVLPDQAKFPDMTALWHQQQVDIEAGSLDIKGFIRGVVEYIGGEVGRVKADGLEIKTNCYPCPTCGKPLLLRKGPKTAFWGCSGYPECKTTLPDDKGKPGKRADHTSAEGFPCPKCGESDGGILRKLSRKDGTGVFWGCSRFRDGCKASFDDKKGKPVLDRTPTEISSNTCMACGKNLIRRKSAKAKGGYFWGCSGYPECKQIYNDIEGRPDYSRKKGLER